MTRYGETVVAAKCVQCLPTFISSARATARLVQIYKIEWTLTDRHETPSCKSDRLDGGIEKRWVRECMHILKLLRWKCAPRNNVYMFFGDDETRRNERTSSLIYYYAMHWPLELANNPNARWSHTYTHQFWNNPYKFVLLSFTSFPPITEVTMEKRLMTPIATRKRRTWWAPP